MTPETPFQTQSPNNDTAHYYYAPSASANRQWLLRLRWRLLDDGGGVDTSPHSNYSTAKYANQQSTIDSASASRHPQDRGEVEADEGQTEIASVHRVHPSVLYQLLVKDRSIERARFPQPWNK